MKSRKTANVVTTTGMRGLLPSPSSETAAVRMSQVQADILGDRQFVLLGDHELLEGLGRRSGELLRALRAGRDADDADDRQSQSPGKALIAGGLRRAADGGDALAVRERPQFGLDHVDGLVGGRRGTRA